MGLTHSNPANRPTMRRSAERNSSENVWYMREEDTRQRQEPEPPDNIILSQDDGATAEQESTAEQEFPIRRQMYFPFHTENTPQLPPPGSWYDELQNNSNQSGGEDDQHEDNEVSLQIALTIVNELAELSAWLQRQSSALEAASHVTFDPEGRPVFDFSTPVDRGPAVPVVPPSYSRATAMGPNLPSLHPTSYQSADYQRFFNRYNANTNLSSPVQYGSPPPSYSRATSQHHANPSQTLTPHPEPGAIARTPPPSYRRAIGDHRERPSITAMDISPRNNDTANNNYISNIIVE